MAYITLGYNSMQLVHRETESSYIAIDFWTEKFWLKSMNYRQSLLINVC